MNFACPYGNIQLFAETDLEGLWGIGIYAPAHDDMNLTGPVTLEFLFFVFLSWGLFFFCCLVLVCFIAISCFLLDIPLAVSSCPSRAW